MREAPVRLFALYGLDGTSTQALSSLRLSALLHGRESLERILWPTDSQPLNGRNPPVPCAVQANWLSRGRQKWPKASWAKDIVMAEPERPQLTPYQVELEAGKRYAWCRCGRSNKQPFCDGSHAGTGIEPLMFTAERSELALLCGCKDTGDPPYCDGSHLLL
jgi:CDGSH-type Zn-finger protein